MASELAISLRVNAILDQARTALKQLRGDLDGLSTSGVTASAGLSQLDDAGASISSGKLSQAARDASQALDTLGTTGQAAGKAVETLDGAGASGIAKVGSAAQDATDEVAALGKAGTDASKQLDIDGAGASSGVAKVGEAAAESAVEVDALGQAATDAGKKLNLDASGAAQSTGAIAQGARDASEATQALDAAASRSAASASNAARAYTDEMSAVNRASRALEEKAAADVRSAASSDDNRDAVARLLAQIDPTERALQRFDEQERQLSAALKSGAIDAEQYAKSLKLAQAAVTAHAGEASGAMKSLGIETARARNELIVIGHEVVSGNFSRIPGSLMVFAESTNLVTFATRLLLNPLTLVAAAAATVAVAFMQAREEQQRFTLAVQSTGNYAGMTRERLDELAHQASAVSNITASAASDAALAMTASGRLGGDTIENLTKSVGTFAQITGQSSEKATAALIKIFENPKRGAEELDSSLHFLSVEQLTYIDNLIKAGQTEEAQLVLSKNLYDYLKTSGVSSVDSLTRQWINLKNAADDYWKSAKRNLTGTTTHDDKITQAQNRLNDLGPFTSDDEKKRLRDFIAQQQAVKKADQDLADSNALLAKQDTAKKDGHAAYDKIAEAYQTSDERRLATLKKLDDALNIDAITQKEHDKAVANVNKSFADKGADRKAFTATRVDTANSLAQLKADLSVQQAQYKDNDAIILQSLKDGTESLQDAYDQRLRIIKQENAAQRAAIQAEIDEVNQALTKARTPEQRGPLDQRRIALTSQLQISDVSLASATRQLNAWKTDAEKQLSSVTAKVRIDVSNLTGTFDRQAVTDQFNLQWQEEYKAAGQLPPEERDAQVARLDMIRQAGIAQAQFNAKLAEAQRLQGALSVQEGSINNQVSTGQISAIEGEAKLQDARAAQVPQLTAIAEQLRQIRDALPTGAAAAIDAANVSIGQLDNTVRAATPTIVDFGTKAKNSAIDSIADAAGNAVTNFENLGEVVKSTLKGIAGDIVKSGIKDLLRSMFSGAGSSSGGGLLSVAFGGAKSLFGFADGGRITGPGTGTSDSIPALVDGKRPISVSDGEWIQPKASVDYYGPGFMEAVRTRRLPRPRYAFGGLVRAATAARYATGGAVSATPSGTAQLSAPNVSIQVVNNGTPQRVADQQTTLNGRDQIITLILEDAQRGGPITRGLSSAIKRS
jgi:phage-related minor tail protein